MRYIFAIAVLFLAATRVAPQSGDDRDKKSLQHAPTVDQCRADSAVWEKADYSTPSLSELFELSREMNDCAKVDPAERSHEQFFKYANVAEEVHSEYTKRLVDFLNRHNLRKQFMSEDEAGKR